jgi:hypothetical protein
VNIRVPVVLAAAIILAACSSQSQPPGSGRSPGSHLAPAAPVSCRVQYQAWRDGTARVPVSTSAAVLAAVRAAIRSGDIPAIRSAMRRLMPAALALAANPMPRCADPAGIYADYVDRIYAAGDNARTATGLIALRHAAAPLTGLAKVRHQLAIELHHAVGTGASEL